jgi:hypothetical protein
MASAAARKPEGFVGFLSDSLAGYGFSLMIHRILRWNVKYETGLTAMDAQHHRLVGRIHRLGELPAPRNRVVQYREGPSA